MPKFHDLLRTALQHGDLRASFTSAGYSLEALLKAARDYAVTDYHWTVYRVGIASAVGAATENQRVYVIHALTLTFEGRTITWDLPLDYAIRDRFISRKRRGLMTQARAVAALEEMFSYLGGDLIARSDCRDNHVLYKLTPDVERVRKLLKQLFGSKMYRRLLRAYDRYQCQMEEE